MNNFLQVFVYGTLKPAQVNYPAYCQGQVIEEKKVYTLGTLYYLSAVGYPAMTPGTTKVYGYLLVFRDVSHIQYLDRLEGYLEGRSQEENEYQRELVKIYSRSDIFLGEVWGYLMRPHRIGLYQGVLVLDGYFNGD